jgi:hypothetical protein
MAGPDRAGEARSVPIRRLLLAASSLALASAVTRAGRADTFQVGPNEHFTDLQSVALYLKPGDVVEVVGDATYPGGVVFKNRGTDALPITIRGVRKNGKRPVIEGGRTTVEFEGDHYLFEGFDVTGGAARCLFHHDDDLTVRDTVVHDCPAHGVLSADQDSGSLTLEYVEVRTSGAGGQRHAIYVASDERAHPGSTFTLRHSYVHDGRGGNLVKSRAERNRIYENWIEGAFYHELELIGPDGGDKSGVREDSDVVGNVFVKTHGAYLTRVGGDGTGQTNGRYRFVNNTFVVSPQTHAVFRLFDGIESIEAHNNAFFRSTGGPVVLVRDVEVRWATGKAIFVGSCNWVPSGSTMVPAGWTNTATGVDPLVEGPPSLAPTRASPLVDAGRMDPKAPAGHAIYWALALPDYEPPPRELEAYGTARRRVPVGPIDVGAFEYGMQPDAGLVERVAADEPPPRMHVSDDVEPAPSPPAPAAGGCGCRSLALRERPHGAELASLLFFAGLGVRRRTGRPKR